MADNTTANLGTGGDVFAAKDLAGIKYPRNIITTPAGTDLTPLSEGGTVAAVTNLAQIAGAAVAMGTGVRSAGTQRVTVATDDLVPVSAASLPLPAGAATETTLAAVNTKLGASLPLPTGASTAAKQPALGVAGTPSVDVLTVQGAAAMTALKVDGSAVTQPVSSTTLATNAVLTGGTVQTKITDGANIVGVTSDAAAGSESAVDRLKVAAALKVLDTAQVAGSQIVAAKGDQTTGLWVNVKNASVPVTGTFWQATQPVSFTQPALVAGTAYIGKTRITDGTLDTTLLNAAPGSDSGQVAVPVRIISSLATGGGGPADVGTSTAASETDATRQKTITSMRLLDTAQTAGTQLVAWKGDQTTGAWVNIKNASIPVTQSGTWNIGTVTTLPALPANQSVNVSQINAVAPLMGNGITGTGSQRVTIASDNTAFSVNAIQSGTWNIGTVTTLPALPANQSCNIAQMNGVAVSMGTGVRGTGVQRVTIATDDIVPASQSGTWTVQPGNTANSTPWLTTENKYPAAAASADGLANPTITQVGVEQMQFNGTTWDRERNNVNTSTGDTGTKTVTFNGATQTNFNARGAFILMGLGTVSGTTPTLSLQLQWSPDSGTTWLNYGAASTAVTTTNNSVLIAVYPSAGTLTSSATQTVVIAGPLPRTWRIVYTIGGTTPSFTIASTAVNYIL